MNNNPGLKNWLDGELSEEWRITTLGKIAKIRRGASPRPIDSPQWFANEGYGWVRIIDVTRSNGRLRSTEQYLSPKGITQSVSVKPGQLIMSICATIGEPAIVEFNVCIHDGFVLFDEYDKNLDTNFLYYFLCYWKPNFRGYGQTGTQANLNTDIVASTPILLPPIPEQQQIAKILDTVDKAIAQTETLIAKYKRVKTGLMQDLLTRGIDEHGQLRDPKTHKFKRSPLGMIPDEKDWICDCADSLCLNISVGIVIQPSKYYCEFGIPALRSANIGENEINSNELVFISERSNQLLSKSIIREGYVLTVRTGYPGTSAVVTKEFDGANCIDVIISKPSSRILPQYLVLWINSHWGKEQVLKNQGGLAQQHFNVKEMKNLLVIRPGIDEQKRIIKIISSHETLLKSELKKLNKLKKIKTGLMQDLLTGKTSVKPLLTNEP